MVRAMCYELMVTDYGLGLEDNYAREKLGTCTPIKLYLFGVLRCMFIHSTIQYIRCTKRFCP